MNARNEKKAEKRTSNKDAKIANNVEYNRSYGRYWWISWPDLENIRQHHILELVFMIKLLHWIVLNYLRVV